MSYNFLNSWKNEEHTGQNRCVPCTILNIVLASILSVVIGLININLGGGLFGIFSIVIYLNGYLVPGTPILTKKYLPDSILELFGKNSPNTSLQTNQHTTERPDLDELSFIRTNKIEPHLSESFEEAIQDQLTIYGDNPEHAVRSIIPYDDVQIRQMKEKVRIAVEDQNRTHTIASWPTKTELLVDAAALEQLSERIPRWERLTPNQQLDLGSDVRALLSECPFCYGELAYANKEVENCCSYSREISMMCSNCNRPLLTIQTK